MNSPHGNGVREQHYFSVRLSVPLFFPSRYLFINHSAEFNQTCYMTSRLVRYARATLFFCPSVCPSICPSRCLLLSHWAEFNRTCYMTYSRGKDVRLQHYFSFLFAWWWKRGDLQRVTEMQFVIMVKKRLRVILNNTRYVYHAYIPVYPYGRKNPCIFLKSVVRWR